MPSISQPSKALGNKPIKVMKTMNHSVKIMGLCALMALVATSCQKNEEKLTNTLTADLNQPTSESKTHIGAGDYLVWDEGDQIVIYDLSGDMATIAGTFTATTGGTTHTTFTGDGLINPDADLRAFYPAQMVSGSGSFSTSTLDTQTYVEGTFAPNTYPMAATNNGTSFTFHGLFGVLAIPLIGNCTIGSVVFTDAASNVTTGNAVTLVCEGGLTLSSTTPKIIRFVLRPGICYSGFTVTFKDLNDNVIFTKTAPANRNNLIRPEYIIQMPTVNITIP